MKKRSLLPAAFAAVICMTFTSPVLAAWEQQGDYWKYQQEDSSYASNRWLQIDGLWYHFDENGIMQTGWLQLKNKWYYLDKTTGYMKTGWFQDEGGKWYYFDDSKGSMLTKTRTPDGYFVDKDGVYDPTKGNTLTGKAQVGPSAKINAEKSKSILKGVEFPPLTAFATGNLSTGQWGIAGSQDSMAALGAAIGKELQDSGTAANANTIQMDSQSILYSDTDFSNPKLKLVKSGDKYDLYDYGSIDSHMETVLLGMCNLISSTPQSVFNAIYTAAQYDRTIMRSEYYMDFGDSKILYTIYDGYVVFSIKAK